MKKISFQSLFWRDIRDIRDTSMRNCVTEQKSRSVTGVTFQKELSIFVTFVTLLSRMQNRKYVTQFLIEKIGKCFALSRMSRAKVSIGNLLFGKIHMFGEGR